MLFLTAFGRIFVGISCCFGDFLMDCFYGTASLWSSLVLQRQRWDYRVPQRWLTSLPEDPVLFLPLCWRYWNSFSETSFFFFPLLINPFEYVFQPDIAAPGVSILAAWSPAASSPTIDMTQKELPPENFMIESGTSMACPHVSGIVALLNSMYPTWSPAAIKSALITTGRKQKNKKKLLSFRLLSVDCIDPSLSLLT